MLNLLSTRMTFLEVQLNGAPPHFQTYTESFFKEFFGSLATIVGFLKSGKLLEKNKILFLSACTNFWISTYFFKKTWHFP